MKRGRKKTIVKNGIDVKNRENNDEKINTRGIQVKMNQVHHGYS